MAKGRTPRKPKTTPAVRGAASGRARAEEALRESEERFRTSVENMLDCFGIYSAIRDASGRIVDFRVEYVNEAACANNRMTQEEQIGKRLLELLPAHRETGLFEEYCQVVEAGRPLTKESLIYEDGYKGHRLAKAFDIRATKLGDGFAAAWRDVTGRKRAEEALLESEERYRSLYRRTPALLHSIDRSGRLLDVSDHWLEVLGYQRDEVIGRKSVEFLTEESKRYAETVTLPEFWKTFCARDIPYQFAKKNGEIIDVLLSAIGERDADGKICRTLAVLIDVTERKRLEEALQQAREELEGKVERQLLRRNPYGLTFRELTVLHHVAAGKADKEIARELGISPLTAQKHVANILGKMNAPSRTDAGVRAVRQGLLD